MADISFLNALILLGALLVLLGILSSLVASRVGAPLLLVFLIVGMLAGEDGPGGIRFDDYRMAYLVGSVSLAVILFDGGLRTRLNAFRGVLWPSITLATVGVLPLAMGAVRASQHRTYRSASRARRSSSSRFGSSGALPPLKMEFDANGLMPRKPISFARRMSKKLPAGFSLVFAV
mgnify:CR=1 FL=1